MPVQLSFVNGLPFVSIDDAKGKPWDYKIEPAGWQGLCRVYLIMRCCENEDASHDYRVTTSGTVWTCSCKAFQFRKHLGADSCKHCLSVSELHKAIGALAG